MLNLMELEEKCRRFLFIVYAEADNSEEISLTFSTIEDLNERYFAARTIANNHEQQKRRKNGDDSSDSNI